MGLDMYLKTKVTICGYDFQSKNEQKKYNDIMQILKAQNVSDANDKLLTVSFTVGYWRKANHIHKWFVDNVQDGEDDCRESFVSYEQLQELQNLCQQVLDNKKEAENILPVQSGFFFGSNDYNEGYYQDIKYTIELINKCLSFDKSIHSLFYQSSW